MLVILCAICVYVRCVRCLSMFVCARHASCRFVRVMWFGVFQVVGLKLEWIRVIKSSCDVRLGLFQEIV